MQDEEPVPPDRAQLPRDYIERAKQEIPALFTTPDKVFFGRQLAVLLEKHFFHWVTHIAATELVQERRLRKETVGLPDGTSAAFYSLPTNRYRRRSIKRTCDLITRYSAESVARACGRQAEILFIAALARHGFVVRAEATRSFGSHSWTRTGHDLDFIIERDGKPWGVEVKNAWDYIDRNLLQIKLDMCSELDVRPLLILRNAPQTYIHDIGEAGGYAMIFDTHIYAYGLETLALEIRTQLGMPTDCPRSIPESILLRLDAWLERNA